MTLPSMDEILAQGRKRERGTSLVLGVILIAGGVACAFGSNELFGDPETLPTLGAIGLGVFFVGRGLFAR